MCFISVIIPTYNGAATIAKCLDSLLKQSFGDFEIIVVDGLSKDDTVNIVEEYTDERISYLSEKDTGIYDAMNKGITLSKGKWLYFLGCDDEVYHEHVFANVHKQIRQHPESKFVYGNVITDNGIERYTDYTYPQLVARCICHQSIFYSRVLFANMRYDLKYKVCADWDFNLKIYRDDIHPVFMDEIIARFNLSGISGDWMNHPEYLAHFARGRDVVKRYRSMPYLYGYYYPYKLFQKLRKKTLWMFR